MVDGRHVGKMFLTMTPQWFVRFVQILYEDDDEFAAISRQLYQSRDIPKG